MTEDKTEKLLNTLQNLKTGDYLDDYDELSERVDNTNGFSLESVYHDNTLWIERWNYNGDMVVTVSYQEGAGILVRKTNTHIKVK